MPVLTADANPGSASWATTIDDVTEVSSDDNASGNTSALAINSGTPSATGTSGDVTISTGSPSGAGTSGDINITPGATTGGTDGTTVITGARTIPNATANAITGATTLTHGDSGGTFSVSQGAAYAITLPTPVGNEGLVYNFYLTAPGANNVTIAPAAGTFIGTIVNDVTSVIPATGSTLTFATGASALGDNIEVRSIGGLYLVRAVTSAAGGITIA